MFGRTRKCFWASLASSPAVTSPPHAVSSADIHCQGEPLRDKEDSSGAAVARRREVRPPSASREHTFDSPRCVARSHQTYSTVSTSFCIQIIKAAWWRGVVMLCDVAWELRNGKLRSTTARGTQRKSKLRSKTSSRDLTTLWTSCHKTSAAPENARESMRT